MSTLKYKFVALYDDGTTYYQNDEDISIRDTKKSCFYDIDHDKLIAFALYKDHEEYTVDLRTGEFLINGISMNNIIFSKDDIEYDFSSTNLQQYKLRLIYFRKNCISLDNLKISEKRVSYLLGWQTTIDGSNIKRIIEIK